MEELIEETQAYLEQTPCENICQHNTQKPAQEAPYTDKNVKWVYVGPPDPWYKRFKASTLLKALKIVLTPEGWWRGVELLAALSEVNLEVHKRPQDPYNTVMVYHRVTRSRVVLRGDGNVDVHANRHLKLDAVVLLQQCSDETDADPTKLFGQG